MGDVGGNTLDGRAGADVMEGRLGDDTYIVDNLGDVVKEVVGGGYDLVKSGVSHVLADEVESLQLQGSAAINGTGNGLSNRLVGNSANNVLDGAGGSDVMIGGLGDDTYVVDDGFDRIVESEGEGTDTVNSSVSFTLGNHLENLSLTGHAAINATGNATNNILRATLRITASTVPRARTEWSAAWGTTLTSWITSVTSSSRTLTVATTRSFPPSTTP
ncbi:hypothetical protein QZH47_02230 [Pseudomonas corrugata]